METQEQILKEQRLRIEVLRHQLLLRYYELLLSLDVLTQAAEVKNFDGLHQHPRTICQAIRE